MAERVFTLNPLARLFTNVFSGSVQDRPHEAVEKLPKTPLLQEPQKPATLAWNLHLQTVAMRMFLTPLDELNSEQKTRAIEEAKIRRPYIYQYWQEEIEKN